MSHIGRTRVLPNEGLSSGAQLLPQSTSLSAGKLEKAIDSSLGQGNSDINSTKQGHPY